MSLVAPNSALVDGRGWGLQPLVRWISDVTRLLNRTGRPLFDHYVSVGNVTTGETDLYSDSVFGNQLSKDGDKIRATYSVQYAANANTKRVRLYFGGTVIVDTTALARNSATALDSIEALIIRESGTVVRCLVTIIAHSGSATLVVAPAKYTRITALTLTGAQILKLTGQSNTASDDITALMGSVTYLPAA